MAESLAWRLSVFQSNVRTRLFYLSRLRAVYVNWWAVFLSKLGRDVVLILRNGTRYAVRAGTTDLAVVNEISIGNPYLGPGHLTIAPDATVVDIGANIGDFTVQVASRCPRGRVIAVEPVADHVRALHQHITMNGLSNVTCRQLAIGGVAGSVSIRGGGNTARVQTGDNASVRMITLAQLMTEEDVDTIDLLKMDCEGAEWDILPAAEAVLPRIRQISMEFHCERGWTPEGLADWLRARGFTVWHTPGPWNGLLWARR
jgi:FkbM family methyltransferase